MKIARIYLPRSSLNNSPVHLTDLFLYEYIFADENIGINTVNQRNKFLLFFPMTYWSALYCLQYGHQIIELYLIIFNKRFVKQGVKKMWEKESNNFHIKIICMPKIYIIIKLHQFLLSSSFRSYLFKTWAIIALHNFLSLVALSNIWFFTISQLPTIHINCTLL